ncbi:Histidine kinase-, DNA gyrase B-, and HSP90-like ATPase [Eubacterium ruminantium]|nr:Histidine kinase-, DNA gyrase B-, and HSP90-like ATPase [Eubacterium ruminantium]
MNYFFILFLNYIEEKIQDILLIHFCNGISFKKKSKRFTKLTVLILISSLISTIMELNINNYFILRLLQITLGMLIIFIISAKRLSIIITIYFFSYLISIVIQYAIVFFFNMIFDDFSDYRIGLLGNLITIILIIILGKILNPKKIFNMFIKNKTSLRIVLVNLFLFFTFEDFIFKMYTQNYKSNITIILTSALLIILINYVIIFEEYRLSQKENDLIKFKNETVLLNELITQVRSKQHEYDNRIATITSLPSVYKDYNSLSDAINSYSQFIQTDTQVIDILQLDNKLVAAFLFYQYKQAQRESKSMHVKICVPTLHSLIPEPKLVDIISILTTNMVEAIDPGDECELRIDCRNNHVIIETVNKGPLLDSNIQQNLFTQGYSTKRIHQTNDNISQRGYGLYNLKRIVSRYHGSYEVYNEINRTTGNTNIIFHIEV